jgi:flagellar hook assembly protein FlgD
MAKSMESLKSSFSSSALSNSANMIGHTVEDGSINANGTTNSFLVSSVKSDNGDIFLVTNAITGYDTETNKATYSSKQTLINMNSIKKIN